MDSPTKDQRYDMRDLLRIMQRLRDPQYGCPWDIAQDFASIVPSTLEECYELAAAIEVEDWPHVEDELGDLLFQVVFYTQLGQEQAFFDFDSVVHVLSDKLLRRHPHVFAQGQIEGVVHSRSDATAVKRQWEQIKAQERGERAQHGALADVPLTIPALQRAQKLQKRAARVGFDWEAPAAVLLKLAEEQTELTEAMAESDAAAVEEELGDLLFTVVNLARHLKVDAESALRRANSKFEQRFQDMEVIADESGASLDGLDAQALEALWERAKQHGRETGRG